MTDYYGMALAILGNSELDEAKLNEIIKKIQHFSLSLGGISEEELDSVKRRLEANIGISMGAGVGLNSGDQSPWLDDRKSEITWKYWDAYKAYLKSSGFSRDVIRVIDEDTDNVLAECGDPLRTESWRIKGLVMGDVQSGKTANYSALINKAADVGYKFIILLTGTIEELRSQTQERLDEGFVGTDSSKILDRQVDMSFIGVGKHRDGRPNVLTSVNKDFLAENYAALGGIPLENSTEPFLVVTKKNASTLRNLVDFLTMAKKSSKKLTEMSLILIDDEADNASINVKKADNPATINSLIRSLLNIFSQSTYVAYTATPFANVFIDPDAYSSMDYEDLFPSNFVYSLNTPSNYIGVREIFGEDGSHSYQLKSITDAAQYFPPKHTKNLDIKEIPDSLKRAIGEFIVGSAIRDLRGEHLRHRSMLVNVTRFTAVQNRIVGIIKSYLYDLVEEIRQYAMDDDIWMRNPTLLYLYGIWNEDYSGAGIDWEIVRRALSAAVSPIKVIGVNQEKTEKLAYRSTQNSKMGRRVIAVGGLTLSRGLTLEGLSVSYFFRNSRAYDTLLQMGRWFGYRTGYSDLCRIWMEPDAQDWYCHLADVVDELKTDIIRMHLNKQKPREFGMKVRSHPGALMITAMNKMRHSEVCELSISYSGKYVETPYLPKISRDNEFNVAFLHEFIERLGASSLHAGTPVWWNIEHRIVAEFIRGLKISQMNAPFMPNLEDPGRDKPIVEFIDSGSVPELAYWDIAIPIQGTGGLVAEISIPTLRDGVMPVNSRARKFTKTDSNDSYYKVNQMRVGGSGDEKIGLSAEILSQLPAKWESERIKDAKKGLSIPGSYYRAFRTRPLLTIHLLSPREADEKDDVGRSFFNPGEMESNIFVAVSLSFPNFRNSTPSQSVNYRINKVAMKQMGLFEEEENEAED